MRVMMTADGFIENTRRRKGSDPARDSFKLERLENFNPRCMVVVKATPEELKQVETIFEERKTKKAAPRTVERLEIRFYKKEEFQDEAAEEDQTSDVKPEPSQYPMKKDRPKGKEKTKDTPTGDRDVI